MLKPIVKIIYKYNNNINTTKLVVTREDFKTYSTMDKTTLYANLSKGYVVGVEIVNVEFIEK